MRVEINYYLFLFLSLNDQYCNVKLIKKKERTLQWKSKPRLIINLYLGRERKNSTNDLIKKLQTNKKKKNK